MVPAWFAQMLSLSPHEASDPHLGMHPAVYALVLGLLSGTSLPIGAWLGCVFSPVSEKVCGCWMAFGAGALLFAVTVELYGHALKEVAEGKSGMVEMWTTIFGAFCGAAFYLVINRWLENYLKADGGTTTTPRCDKLEDEEMPRETDPLISPVAKQGSLSAREESPIPAKAKSMANRRSSLPSEPVITPMSPRSISSMQLMRKKELGKVRSREKALRALYNAEEITNAKSVAAALFLGLLVDGVPEGILIGFLSAEGHLTPVLIISLFVANFPEALASASLLIQAEMGIAHIIGLWTSLCLLVGGLAGFSCYAVLLMFPAFGHGGLQAHGLPMSVKLGIALIEGLTGGAMIACISAVMLPEAFERAGKNKADPFYTQSGFLCTAGFLLSVGLKATLG